MLFTERFKKSAGYMAKCEVAPTASIRSRVQSRSEPFILAVSKIDKKFCLGVFWAQKHEFEAFITPTPQEIRFFFNFYAKLGVFVSLKKGEKLHKNWKKSFFRGFGVIKTSNSCFWAKNTLRQKFLSILDTAKRNGSARDWTLDLMRASATPHFAM